MIFFFFRRKRNVRREDWKGRLDEKSGFCSLARKTRERKKEIKNRRNVGGGWQWVEGVAERPGQFSNDRKTKKQKILWMRNYIANIMQLRILNNCMMR